MLYSSYQKCNVEEIGGEVLKGNITINIESKYFFCIFACNMTDFNTMTFAIIVLSCFIQQETKTTTIIQQTRPDYGLIYAGKLKQSPGVSPMIFLLGEIILIAYLRITGIVIFSIIIFQAGQRRGIANPLKITHFASANNKSLNLSVRFNM